jgi:hypothetical protein
VIRSFPTRHGSFAAFAAVLLLLAACGDDDGPPPGTDSGPPPADADVTDATMRDGDVPPVDGGPIDTDGGPIDTDGGPIDTDGGPVDVDGGPMEVDAGPRCATPEDCDDGDACTVDSCTSGDCAYAPVSPDDGDLCTSDACDPTTGVSNTAIVGCCRSEADCDSRVCVANTCRAATCDDGVKNGAETDIDCGGSCASCALGDACALAADCTSGFCVDGACVECVAPTDCPGTDAECSARSCTANVCGVSFAARGTPLAAQTDRDCLRAVCDGAGGSEIIHDNDDLPIDGDLCTTVVCTDGTPSNPTVDPDDRSACTVDACDPATGVSNTPIDTSDEVACTVDTCDADTGAVTHTPRDTACDDGVACTVDTCDATRDCRATPSDARCPSGSFCDATRDCVALPRLIVTEFSALGTEMVELHVLDTTDVDVRGWAIRDALGGAGIVRAATDPTGMVGEAVVIPAGGYAFGVPNPADPADIPAGAAFVYGEPGSAPDLDDTGDTIDLLEARGYLIDRVDFTALHTNLAADIPLDAFPARSGITTQLDPSARTQTGNDDGDAWCLSWRATDTRGAANSSCTAFVINEVLYDFDHPTLSNSDESRVFVELAGPPGGSLRGVRVRGLDGDGVGDQAPSVTIGVSAGVVSTTRMPLDGFFVIADGTANNVGTLVPEADLVLGNADPTNGNTNGDAIELYGASGTRIDAVAYGPATMFEGTPVADLDPSEVALSLARDRAGTDSNDNAVDFHNDPTPTPGRPNLAVQIEIVDVSTDDAPAGAVTQVVIRVRDAGDFATSNGTALADNDVDGRFAARATTDTASTADGCSILDIEDEGRGIATLRCTAPSNADVGERGDFVVSNPTAIGGSATWPGRWTYTTARNETGSTAEADVCSLFFPTTLATSAGVTPGLVVGRVSESGLTGGTGAPVGLLAEVGYGPTATSPATDAGWRFTPASFVADVGSEDEFSGALPALTAPGAYAYGFRVSFDDGLSYTYCDRDGAGSNAGLTFLPAQLGLWTVTP